MKILKKLGFYDMGKKQSVITYRFEIYKSYTTEDKSPHFLTIGETHMESDAENVVLQRCVEF